MKTQKSTIEKYFPFVFLVIAVHVGLVIWILHNSLRVLNSDSQQLITVSLRIGDHHSQAQNHLNASTIRSNHHAGATIPAATPSVTQGHGDGETQKAAGSPSPSKQGDLGFSRRSQFFNPKPPYPLASRRMGEQGAVHLKLCIGSHGFVESVGLTQSSGYQNLDRSAIETVKAWKFSALSKASENASECYQLPIHFQLES